ncbi:hypothetical protein [Undibacterium sp. JH2W]|uniref:hypothetical protein n=1 Tax=Undibacterium sp. JH2W TaxID=3413037 RepID=UPI003BF5A21F
MPYIDKRYIEYRYTIRRIVEVNKIIRCRVSDARLANCRLHLPGELYILVQKPGTKRKKPIESSLNRLFIEALFSLNEVLLLS